MKFEVGKKYMTRDGTCVVRVLAIDLASEQTIAVARQYLGLKGEILDSYYADGKYRPGEDSYNDLIAEYKEPQPPRKLYAYQVGDTCQISLFTDRLIGPVNLNRAPEYDIEFPD